MLEKPNSTTGGRATEVDEFRQPDSADRWEVGPRSRRHAGRGGELAGVRGRRL